MKKLQSVLILLILALTIFSSFNFTFQSAVASPPATGDKAFANASVSYTHVNYWQQQPTTNLKLWAINNTTANDAYSNYAPGWAVGYGTGKTSGTFTSPLQYLNTSASTDWYFAHNNTFYDVYFYFSWGGSGTAEVQSFSVNLWVGGTEYAWSDTVNYVVSATNTYFNEPVAFSIASPTSATFEVQFSVTMSISGSTSGYLLKAYSINTDSGITSQSVTTAQVSGSSYVPSLWGWSYNYKSISSSFSILSNTISYELNWTAQQKSNATYNSITQSGVTSGHFTGSLSVTSITFNSDFININQDPYAISYFLTENTTTPESYTYSEQSYTYTISQNDNYFNSSLVYFNYTLPSTASTSYSASYSLKISNLTLTNPAAPVDSLSLVAPSFTYYSLSKYKSTYNVTAYQNYSSAQNANTKFSTSEIVNYYPTINYSNIKWTGTGSKAELVINATTVGGGYTFSESLQILNINWGDGSALQSSSEQTGSYNWTLYHYYSTTGSFSVSFQIENWVGNSNALSTSKTLTYQITVGITAAPANGAVLGKDQKVFFNWTDTNAGMTSVRLTIDSLVQQTNAYSSLLAGSFNFTPTYLGLLTVSWYWVAGNVTGYSNLSYTTSTVVDPLGLYVIFNWTLSGTTYSNYWYSPPDEQYNQTWWYYDFTVSIPNGSTLQTVKGANNWIFDTAAPGLYVYYENNASIHFYQKATVYQVVFIAPLPPTSAYFTIKLEDAAGNTIGASGASFETFNVFVDGKPTSSDIVNAQTGETYNVKVYSEPFGTLLSNSNFTVSYQVSEDVIQLDVYPLAVQNLNQTYFALFSVGQNGVTKNISYIGMGQTDDFSIVAGTYYLNFSLWGQNGYTGLRVSRLTTITGPSIQWLSGTTLAQVTSQIKNQTTLIENVNLTLVSQGDSIKNQTINIQVSVKDLNSTIGTQLTSFNVTLQDIMSIVDHSNTTLSQKIVYTDSLINASDYRYVPGTPTISGLTYSYPIQVIFQRTDLPANLSQTQEAAHNLQAQLVESLGAVSIPFYVTDIKSGSFTLNINLTQAQVNQIQKGAYISMVGAIGIANAPVSGKISSSNLPPNLNTVSGIFGYLGYLEGTPYGRAEYLIAGLLALMYYIVVLTRKNEKKARRK